VLIQWRECDERQRFLRPEGSFDMLTERQRLILSAIVDDYIRSAEPVGSRSISKRGDVGFSPATIRNEMSDLEEMGFLEQPHTSAGRIPSHKGYRYYVDHLLRIGQFTGHEVDIMKLFFAERIQEIEQVIQQASIILSNITNYTSIVLGPELFSTTLRHLQLIPLNDHTAVAIIVTNTGHVENRTVSIPEDVPMSELEKVVAILNAKLSGVPLLHLKSKLYNEIGEELRKYVSKYEELIQLIESVLDNDEDSRIFLSGTTNMLIQPEFKDVEKVKTILDLLDQTPTLIKMFSSAPAGIQVRIGTENHMEAINNCSLITATYSIDGQSLGTIGILGPTRMEYAKVIGLLDHFSKDMALVLARWYK
jgi:heat-inducible transcriptional repressor